MHVDSTEKSRPVLTHRTNRRLPTGVTVILVVAAVSAGLLYSCSRRERGPEQADSYAIDRTFSRGPVDFRVAVSRKEISIAERIILLLETRSKEGYRVELPAFGDMLHEFGIVDYRTPPPQLGDDGSVVTRRFYELEPFLSGEYRIPPMTVSFWQQGDSLRYTLESDTITVGVRSILPEDQVELEIRDIAGPIGLASEPYRALIVVCCAAAAAALAFLWWRRRRARERAAPPIPPHERAFLRLERLLASTLLEEKRYKEFTAAVSDILRHYIEDRFNLRAPEMTTEEFLAAAGPGLPVDPARTEILAAFLHHCDLVKFAAFEPSSDDVRRTFETCRDFIDATKVEEVREEAA